MKGLISSVCLVALLALIPNSVWAQAPAATSKPATQTAKPKTATAKPAGTDPALLHPATLKAQAPAEYDAKFVTTKGEFVIHVTRAWAPLGADRFYNLVKHHFYDGASFFRFVDGFVVQFGLTGSPAVNKAWTDANIKDDPVKSGNKPGFITFAMAGKDTRTTQVFINLGDNSRLDSMGFAPFGQVTSGMDVVKSFYSGYADAPTSHQDEITNNGKAYLDTNFPKLDSIKTATIAASAGSASAAAPKTAAAGASKPKAQPKPQ
ncbi:MAG: peptidylprolyl isomerase [Candidatus Acidiferrales bacterium]